MTVFSYYEPIGGGAEPVISLWRESWERHGWTCHVLGDQDFVRLPFSGAIDYLSKRLPTINDFRYERACYRRWLAAAGVGGGVLVDYDVINFGFTPNDIPAYCNRLMMFDAKAPCAMYGRVWDYLRCVDMFIAYHPQDDDLHTGHPHVSDMTIVNRYRHTAQEVTSVCSELAPDNSNKTPLVHFPTVITGESKEKRIREFMEARK